MHDCMMSSDLIKKHGKYFFNSLRKEGVFGSVDDILLWIKLQNEKVDVCVEMIDFEEMTSWFLDKEKSAIRHETGRFFSIEGIRVNTNFGGNFAWDQPIINQPEIGYLGFIVKEIEGILHFLTQAKVEPGNVNRVQLSPTIQATRSNYTQVHKGNKPLYLEYFAKVSSNMIMFDQLQSEQGSRFLHKRNRNMIVKIEDDVPLFDNFIWLTLGQLKCLMRYANVVNMDTRTVLSGIAYGHENEQIITDTSIRTNIFIESTFSSNSVHGLTEILHFITDFKCKYMLDVAKIPLCSVNQWQLNSNEISRPDGKYFKVIAVDVLISNREMTRWQQPMVQPTQPGIHAFICKKINGVIHFAVQIKLECGLKDVVEIAPTVQCSIQDNIETTPYLKYILNVSAHQIVIDTIQSEEGGRFYHEQNRNMVVIAGNEFSENLPENYFWLTLNQLLFFVKLNNYVNLQARSLIAAISIFD